MRPCSDTATSPSRPWPPPGPAQLLEGAAQVLAEQGLVLGLRVHPVDGDGAAPVDPGNGVLQDTDHGLPFRLPAAEQLLEVREG